MVFYVSRNCLFILFYLFYMLQKSATPRMVNTRPSLPARIFICVGCVIIYVVLYRFFRIAISWYTFFAAPFLPHTVNVILSIFPITIPLILNVTGMDQFFGDTNCCHAVHREIKMINKSQQQKVSRELDAFWLARG